MVDLELWNATLMNLDKPSPDQVLAWQLKRLQTVLLRFRDRSPHYSRLFNRLNPASIQSVTDLVRLPFTRPEALYSDPKAFLCVPGSEVAKITTLRSSGTSGERKRIAFSETDLERTVSFFQMGMQNIVQSGERCLIMMPGTAQHSIGRLLQTALSRIGVDSEIGGIDWSIERLATVARGAECIVGIPGELIWFCRHCPGLRPKAVLLSADYIPESVVSTLEETWKTRVFHHYGLTETGYGCAVHCAHRRGQHIRDAELLIEIVDPVTGAPLPPGEKGEIVITTLQNEAMPLIRYRTGDIGRMIDTPCSCGGRMPRLGRVEGRLQNDIPLHDGQSISIHCLDEILFALPQVRSFTASLDFSPRIPQLTLTVDVSNPIAEESVISKLPRSLSIIFAYSPLNPIRNRAKRMITFPTER